MNSNGKLHIVSDKTVCVLNHCTGRRKKVDKNDTLSAFCSHHAELFLSLISLIPGITLQMPDEIGNLMSMKIAWVPVEEAKKGSDIWTPGN